MATTGRGGSLRRRSRRPLDRESILAAAVALVDREGLGALNMRALASGLGVGTMSLYHHVPNKEALLDGVVEAVMAEMEVPDPESGPWEERASRMARSLRAVAMRHPGCIPLLVTRPFATGPSLGPCEAAFGILAEAGLDPEHALIAFRTILAYVLGFVTMESAGFFGGVGPEYDRDALLELGLPNLARLVPHLAGRDVDADFDAGLQIVEQGALVDWSAGALRT
ncbi:MAG TPA: TetR/AcrR family transcriptional regulator C-terminal domain-containing protein [Acidimicrobiales bacterium]|nr:TetR/AcrR family transcriptional regulator C-terminal domain-containing protein [Acidimicrobiales bacterium]